MLDIVIVDAGSDDGTLELAEKYGAEHVLDNPLRTGRGRQGPRRACSEGRRAGLRRLGQRPDRLGLAASG